MAPTAESNAIFVEPMFGNPLALYLDKDIDDRAVLVELVKVTPFSPLPCSCSRPRNTEEPFPRDTAGSNTFSVSSITHFDSHQPYFHPVNPHKRSGQNLYRQYANKKTKAVLDARWIRECIKAAALQTFATNWAGCKLDGTETSVLDFETRRVLIIPPAKYRRLLHPAPVRVKSSNNSNSSHNSSNSPSSSRRPSTSTPRLTMHLWYTCPPSWLRPRLRPRPSSPGRLPLLYPSRPT